MKTGKKRLTGTLLALCAALLVLCIVLAIGWSKTAKADAVLPEVRTTARRFSGNTEMNPIGATLWRLPNLRVLPEKTERTAQTVKTALTVPTVRTE